MSLTGYTIRTSTFDGIAGEQTSASVFNSKGTFVKDFYFPFAALRARIWAFTQFLRGNRG